MKKMTRIFSVFLICCLVPVFMGCQSGTDAADDKAPEVSSEAVPESSGDQEASGEVVTLRVLDQNTDTTEEMAAFLGKIDEYAKGVADRYVIEHEGIAGDDIKTVMKTYVAANNAPDLVEYWNSASDSGSMMEAGLFLPTDEFFAASENLSKEDFMESHYYYYDGVSYGIPMDHSSGVWLANKEIFEQYGLDYPKTYDDIIEIGKVLQPNGIITLAMGSKGGNPLHFPLDDLYGRYEGAEEEMNSIATTGVIKTDLFVEALQYVEKMRDAGCFPSDTITNGDWGPTLALYNEGRAAMYYLLTPMASSLTDEAVAWSQIIDHPQVTGDKARADQDDMGIFMGNKAMFINKASWEESEEKRAAIIDYLDFYFSDEMCQAYYEAKGTQPAKDLEYSDENAVEMSKRMNEYYASHPNITKSAQLHMLTIPNDTVWADYQSFLDEFLSGAVTAEEYAAKVQDSLDRNYKRE